jgi:hypothetical protein
VDALTQRLLAGGFDGRQPIAQHGGQYAHHLPVTIGRSDQLAADPLQPGRASNIGRAAISTMPPKSRTSRPDDENDT